VEYRPLEHGRHPAVPPTVLDKYLPGGHCKHVATVVAPATNVVNPCGHAMHPMVSSGLYVPNGHGTQAPSTKFTPYPGGHATVQSLSFVAPSPLVVCPLGHCTIDALPAPQK
jgi:hypothetical protein